MIPGIVFLVLIWLPFALIAQKFPPDLLLIILGLVFGYIAGHILQGLAKAAFPAKIKDTEGELRIPSDLLLDDKDITFSSGLKTKILEEIKTEFNIDASSRNNRQESFMLCRGRLFFAKCPSYTEQFEGMYALMRGIMIAFLLGGGFHFGWGVSKFLPSRFRSLFQIIAAGFMIIFYILILFQCIINLRNSRAKSLTKAQDRIRYSKIKKWFFWIPMIFLVILGIFFGSKENLCSQISFLFIGICAICIFIFFRCYAAYLEFAILFAKTVYQDFILISEHPKTKRQKPKS
jgi:hypothetical protein